MVSLVDEKNNLAYVLAYVLYKATEDRSRFTLMEYVCCRFSVMSSRTDNSGFLRVLQLLHQCCPTFLSWRATRSNAEGARIEVPKAPTVWGAVSPSHWEGSGEGTVPPPQKFFRFLSSKWRVLVHSWCKNYYIRTVVRRQHICLICYYFLIKNIKILVIRQTYY